MLGTMDKAVDGLGLYDFFNVIMSGSLFLLSVVWIIPDVWEWYVNIYRVSEKYICILLLLVGSSGKTHKI